MALALSLSESQDAQRDEVGRETTARWVYSIAFPVRELYRTIMIRVPKISKKTFHFHKEIYVTVVHVYVSIYPLYIGPTRNPLEPMFL